MKKTLFSALAALALCLIALPATAEEDVYTCWTKTEPP